MDTHTLFSLNVKISLTYSTQRDFIQVEIILIVHGFLIIYIMGIQIALPLENPYSRIWTFPYVKCSPFEIFAKSCGRYSLYEISLVPEAL